MLVDERPAGLELVTRADDPEDRSSPSRSKEADDRPPWHPEQALTPREALAVSVDGRGSVHAGMPADLALLDADPLAEHDDTAAAAAALRTTPVVLTVVAGETAYSAL